MNLRMLSTKTESSEVFPEARVPESTWRFEHQSLQHHRLALPVVRSPKTLRARGEMTYSFRIGVGPIS